MTEIKIKIGSKVALVGGGGVMNMFHVVIFKGEKKEKNRVVLETNPKDLPNPFEPIIGSWKLAVLDNGLEDLPLGRYCFGPDEIVDISNIGIFGSILNGKIVKIKENGKWRDKK